MGFIVAAANTTNTGSGREMLAGPDDLTRFNGDPASPFYNKVGLTRVGATATPRTSPSGRAPTAPRRSGSGYQTNAPLEALA